LIQPTKNLLKVSLQLSVEFEIYPLSSKNSNITTTNATRKKMFSSKNQEIAVRPLTITKQNTEESSISLGYCHIRNKIIDL